MTIGRDAVQIRARRIELARNDLNARRIRQVVERTDDRRDATRRDVARVDALPLAERDGADFRDDFDVRRRKEKSFAVREKNILSRFVRAFGNRAGARLHETFHDAQMQTGSFSQSSRFVDVSVSERDDFEPAYRNVEARVFAAHDHLGADRRATFIVARRRIVVHAHDEVLVFAKRVTIDDARALTWPKWKRRGSRHDDFSSDEKLHRAVVSFRRSDVRILRGIFEHDVLRRRRRREHRN